jgi:methanogen homocitrate synthase
MGELGMGALEDEKIGLILDEVKSTGIAKRDVLTNEEFTNIVAAVMSK